MKPLTDYLKDGEVKVVWKEEDRTKVGRGKITHDDENFVYLTGEKAQLLLIRIVLLQSNNEISV